MQPNNLPLSEEEILINNALAAIEEDSGVVPMVVTAALAVEKCGRPDSAVLLNLLEHGTTVEGGPDGYKYVNRVKDIMKTTLLSLL